MIDTFLQLTIHSMLSTLTILFSGFIITGVFTSRVLYLQYYDFLFSLAKTKKATLLSICLVSGLIPVAKRTSVTAPILDSVIKDDQHEEFKQSSKRHRYLPESTRGKMGVLDYLSDSLYYLMSPIDRGFLIIMLGLSYSYFQLISYLLLPIGLYIICLLYGVLVYIKEDDIEFYPRTMYGYNKWELLKSSPIFFAIPLSFFVSPAAVFGITALYYYFVYKVTLRELKLFIRVKSTVAVIVTGLIVIAVTHFNISNVEIYRTISTLPLYNEFVMVVALLSIGIVSYLTASRTVYGCYVVILTMMFGHDMFPLIFCIGYAGYLLSSNHTCLSVSASYFQSNIIEMYRCVAIVAQLLVVGGMIVVAFNMLT